MRTLIDFEHAMVFAIPAVNRSGLPSIREGMLLEGPQGWGEFSPLPGDDAAAWLTAATCLTALGPVLAPAGMAALIVWSRSWTRCTQSRRSRPSR